MERERNWEQIAPWGWLVPLGLLILVLALGQGIHAPAARAESHLGSGGDSASYARQVDLLLQHTARSLALAGQLLDERDANPSLSSSPSWRDRHAAVVAELEAEYHEAQQVSAPAGSRDLQICLVEGLQLSALGHSLLHQAFSTDGHGAYYFSAHGNWDLNLGAERLRQCHALLARTAPAPGP